jgi:hypothetical protein
MALEYPGGEVNQTRLLELSHIQPQDAPETRDEWWGFTACAALAKAVLYATTRPDVQTRYEALQAARSGNESEQRTYVQEVCGQCAVRSLCRYDGLWTEDDVIKPQVYGGKPWEEILDAREAMEAEITEEEIKEFNDSRPAAREAAAFAVTIDRYGVEPVTDADDPDALALIELLQMRSRIT